MKFPPAATYASSTSKDRCSSSDQPNTLPPRHTGNTSRSVWARRAMALTLEGKPLHIHPAGRPDGWLTQGSPHRRERHPDRPRALVDPYGIWDRREAVAAIDAHELLAAEQHRVL